MSGVGRVAAVGAVIAAVVLVALVLFGGASSSYEVTAEFINAGQIVKGNPVQSGGVAVGTVEKISITSDGHAKVKMKIKGDQAPLRVGTRAQIKQFSLAGLANRYVDLTYPPNGSAKIADGGDIGLDKTTTAVDLDQLFDTLDPPTRKAIQDFLQGSAQSYHGVGAQAYDTFHYLNPALATSSRLFNQLTKDQPLLEAFLVDSSKLVTTLASRKDDLAGLIGNLNTTTRALGNQKAALASSIGELPPFMRRANTTFVNLRAALDDVDPLVQASKPVAAQLAPFLSQTRSFANRAVPTVKNLRTAIGRPGPSNDLTDLLKSSPALADIATATKSRNGKDRPGSFPQTASAFKDATKIISEARPYTTDFLGWFDDFSTTGGGFDALGAYARASISLAENLTGGPPTQKQFKRCPGAGEGKALDGSNVLSDEERQRLDCIENDRAVKQNGTN